jgi:hypothetical protein
VETAYTARLRDAFQHLGPDSVTLEEFERLRIGRHFRLSDAVKLVIGRDETENARLLELSEGHTIIEPLGIVGPITLLRGDPNPSERNAACALAARYSDHAEDGTVTMRVRRGGDDESFEVEPLAPEDPRIDRWRIG